MIKLSDYVIKRLEETGVKHMFMLPGGGAMHLNDAKKECGSRVDRHECLGKGCIGQEGFKYIMQSPYFENMPLVLETPEPDLWADEIKLLRSFE